MNTTRKPLADRLWAKIERRGPDECWPWMGSIIKDGYGEIRLSGVGSKLGRLVRTHRVAFELENGPIPDGMCVCHKCDVRACCNPAHLFLGTPADNNADRDSKGRHVPLKDERHGCVKLTPEQVYEIIDASGKQRDIAAKYGVTQAQIWNIKHRKSWAHLTPPKSRQLHN